MMEAPQVAGHGPPSTASRLLSRALHQGLLGVGLWLAVTLSLAPGALAVCTNSETGSVLVATLVTSPRPWGTVSSGNGIFYHRITDVNPGTAFELEPVIVESNVLGVIVPDFDIVFYSASACTGGTGTPTGDFSTLGDESGTVPSNSACALVYMRIGPGTAIPNGNRFEYRDDC